MPDTSSDDDYTEYVTARLHTLHRLAFLLCGDSHRADDLVQQTITNLYVHWSRASAATNLDAYVRTMLVRSFIDEKRRGWSRVRLFAETPHRSADVARAGPNVEDRQLLRDALSRLPRRQQAVLVLRFLCDMSVAETAEALKCSEGNIKSQTSHGLAAIRRVLGPQTLALLAGGTR
jgi:RNA polymerase sigma-70 factor (sigma-E family)